MHARRQLFVSLVLIAASAGVACTDGSAGDAGDVVVTDAVDTATVDVVADAADAADTVDTPAPLDVASDAPTDTVVDSAPPADVRDAPTCPDADGDRHQARSCGGDDCNDANASVHPGNVDVCNGIDDNCDGTIDEGVLQTFYVDADGDGFGNSTAPTMLACSVPAGYATSGTDCDDTQAAVHPGAVEVCDVAGVDENCDGMANPASLCACAGSSTRACAAPGACAAGTQMCTAGTWGACSIGPVAETCNGIDDDCNGAVDNGATCPSGMTCSSGACR